MRMLAPLAFAALLAGAPPAAAQESRSFDGPMHFCGSTFAIEIAAGEQIAWQQGPDFDVYSLLSPGHSFGLYEGFYPDTYETSPEPVTLPGGRHAERLRGPGQSVSYLIRSVEGTPTTYLHLFGQVWHGDATDMALLSRLSIGTSEQTGCRARSVETAPPATSGH